MSMSGSTIGTFAGAVVGAVIGTFVFPGIGTALGASLGATLGGLIGGTVDYLTAGDQINRQESLAGLQIQASAYGQPMTQVFGTYRLAGNIIVSGPKETHEHRTTQGGKGGPKRVSITKTYTIDLALALCDTLLTGPMSGISKAWADGTLIYTNAFGAPLPTGWTFYPGTDTQPADPTVAFWTGIGPRYIHTCYVVMSNYDMGPYPRVPNFTFEVTQGERPLPGVVTAMAEAAGVPASDLVLTDLPSPSVRYLLSGVQSVRGMLEQLMVAYRFYVRERGPQLEFRGMDAGDVLADITAADLDASERAGQTQGLRIARERSRVLPTQLYVSYTAVGRDYQPATQLATVGTLASVESPRTVTTAVALEDADAKALAQENLDRVWIERTSFALEVGRRWAALEPGDRVRVTSRDYTHTVFLTEAQYGRPGLVQLKGRSDATPVMFVPGAPPAVGDFPEVILAFLEQTIATFLDLPAMDSNDQAPRYHVVYSYPEEDWPGATLHRSRDGGASYDLVHAGTLEVIGGTALTALPVADPHFTDTTSTVEVHLEHGQLISVTPEAFQGGGNLAMLGNELLQFREAELIAAGTYRLSHFWRGRRGTEWAVGTHAAGERFTWIDQAVYDVEVELGERYVTRQWKAVTNGLDIASATAQTYAVLSENLKPWSVSGYRQMRQVTNDWLLQWRGRARFTGAWIDGGQASPDPDFLTYRVTIYSDGTYATVVRTLDQADSGDWQAVQTYTYSAADQSTDFGAPQTVLYAIVLQVGRVDVSRPQAA
jgi:putative tail protein/outer membrane protein with glycine zipper